MPDSAPSSLWKLSAMTLGIVASAMVLMWVFTTVVLRHSFDAIGRAIIEDDLEEYSVTYEEGGAAAVASLFRAGGHDGQDQILRLTKPDGSIALDVLIPTQPGAVWGALPRLPHPPGEGGETDWSRHELPGRETLTVGRRRLRDGAELWFGRTNASDLVVIARIHRYLLLSMAVTTALAIGPVIWFSGRVLRPVRALSSSARSLVSEGFLERRLEPSSAIPELHDFARAFNGCLDRVENLTAELEAANDQLAHELRTPLARIRGNVEKILRKPSDEASVREDAGRAIEEIEKSSALIQAILSVRAGDSGAMKLEREEGSLVDLVRELLDLYSASIEERKLRLKLVEPEEDGPVSFDRQRLQQAICNLLDNAIGYTPEGGVLEVEVRREAESAIVLVRDTGPGLSESDPDRIWRRFVRGSAASVDVPGIGLGLSLVRAVARAHGGSASSCNRPEGGAEFRIDLPVGADGGKGDASFPTGTG